MYDDLSPLTAHPELPTDRPFTHRRAVELGISREVLRRMVRVGLLRRVLKGVYVDAAADDGLLLRCRAVALVVPNTAVVTDRTAAWLHGIDALRPGDHLVPPPVEVFQLPGHTRVRTTATSGGERTLLPRDVEVVHGVRVTTPLRTALDLGRLTRRDHAIAALDALLGLGRFTHDDLLRDVERFRRQRGVVQLRELAPIADGRAESPGESVLRLRWLDTSLPRPDLQVEVRENGLLRARLDLAVPDLRFAVEYDGWDWHSSAAQRAHDRQRRDWLRAHGWTVVVLTRREVFEQPHLAAQRIREALLPLLTRRAG
jgi:very-short-patch-repair endonuclease